jgi:hypothetical protein
VTNQDPAVLIDELAGGYLAARCVHVAANLGLADAIGDEPRELTLVAADLGVDRDALERVVRYLASRGVFDLRDGVATNNDPSRLLRAGDPAGLLPLIRMLGLQIIWDAVGSLEDTVRTGRAGATFHDPDGFFGYLGTHEAESRVYDAGMTAMTERRIARILPHYDFTPFQVIADIGGGRGHLLRAVLDLAPDAHGILFDRPHVVDGAVPDDRVTIRPGDFFEGPMPEADVYLLSNIIHDWDDEAARTILHGVHVAAKPGSTLLLFEYLVPDDAGPFDASEIDAYMLALVSGRERRRQEYETLLADSGWRLTRTIATDSQTILEAKPA